MVVKPALAERPVDEAPRAAASTVRHGDELQVLADGEIRVGAHEIADDGDLGADHEIVLGQHAAAVGDPAGGGCVAAGRDAQQG